VQLTKQKQEADARWQKEHDDFMGEQYKKQRAKGDKGGLKQEEQQFGQDVQGGFFGRHLLQNSGTDATAGSKSHDSDCTSAESCAACIVSALVEIGPLHKCAHGADANPWGEQKSVSGTSSTPGASQKVLVAGLLFNNSQIMAHYTAQVGCGVLLVVPWCMLCVVSGGDTRFTGS
jgi:hypothetical protein